MYSGNTSHGDSSLLNELHEVQSLFHWCFIRKLWSPVMFNLSTLRMDNLNPGHGHLKQELCLCLMERETMCALTLGMDLNKLPSPEQVLTNRYLNLYTRGFSIFCHLSENQKYNSSLHFIGFKLHSGWTLCVTCKTFLLTECQESGEPSHLLVGKVCIVLEWDPEMKAQVTVWT